MWNKGFYNFINLLKHGVFSLFLICFTVCKSQSTNSPNVLFIISDDLSTALSGYGHRHCKTPNIDRIAEKGITFTRAYNQFPLCGPSRASIMTGQYPSTIAKGKDLQQIHFRKLNPDIYTIPQLFRERGYYSARVSKVFHNGVPGAIMRRENGHDDEKAWDYRYNVKGPEHEVSGVKEDLSPLLKNQGFFTVKGDGDDQMHTDGLSATKAIEILKDVKEPFFLAVGMVRPHVPLVAPKSYFDMYPPEKMILPHVPEGDLDDVPNSAKGNSNERRYKMTEEQQRKTLSAYYASISYMDAQVGRVLDALTENQLDKNTIVVFISDHGYNMGEHTFYQKVSLWEDTTRTPMIISVPWLKDSWGSESNKFVELIDIFPTLTELTNIDHDISFPGRSLLPLLKSPDMKSWEHRPAFTINARRYSIRDNQWRYTVNKRDRKKDVELYNLDSDPNEYTNLASNPQYIKIIEKLNKKLDKVIERTKSSRIKNIARN